MVEEFSHYRGTRSHQRRAFNATFLLSGLGGAFKLGPNICLFLNPALRARLYFWVSSHIQLVASNFKGFGGFFAHMELLPSCFIEQNQISSRRRRINVGVKPLASEAGLHSRAKGRCQANIEQS